MTSALKKQHTLRKMTEMKLRKRKASPKTEATYFTAVGKNKDGFDVKYINADNGTFYLHFFGVSVVFIVFFWHV